MTSKHGPCVLRNMTYVTNKEPRLWSLKRSGSGKYVMVEGLDVSHKKRRTHTQLANYTPVESMVSMKSMKPNWKLATKNKHDKRLSADQTDLPPIDLGYKSKAHAIVDSLKNVNHRQNGGNKPIFYRMLKWAEKDKVRSLDNAYHKTSVTTQTDPIISRPKVNLFRKAPLFKASSVIEASGLMLQYNPDRSRFKQLSRNIKAQVLSMDNLDHVTVGGADHVMCHNLDWNPDAIVGSLANAHHAAGGDNDRINNRRVSWKTNSRIRSLENIGHRPRDSNVVIPNCKASWESCARVGSLSNIRHRPGGGTVNIFNEKLMWNVLPKIDSRLPKKQLMMK